MKLINIRIFLFLLLLTPSALYAADPAIPPVLKNQRLAEANIRSFVSVGSFDLMADMRGNIRTDVKNPEIGRKAVTLGSYYNIVDGFQIGAFYMLNNNTPNANDWIKKDGAWTFRDTAKRLEHVFIADVTFRSRIEKIPGLILEFKTRYLNNNYTSSYLDGKQRVNMQMFGFRPGLSWNYTRGGEVKSTVYLQNDFYIPLNFQPQPSYADNTYLGVLFHVKPWLSIGPYGAYYFATLTESKDIKTLLPGKSYRVPWTYWALGLNLIFYFED